MTEIERRAGLAQLRSPGSADIGEEPLGAGDDEDVGRDAFRVKPSRGFDRLRHHDPGGGDLDTIARVEVWSVVLPVDQAIPAGEDRIAQLAWIDSAGDQLRQRLIDRLGREAQVGRRAVLAVGAAGDRFQQHPLDFVREGRLVEANARQLDAERGRDGALVRAAFRAERDAGGRAGEDHLGADIETVDQSVEARGRRTGRRPCRSGSGAGRSARRRDRTGPAP